MHSVYFYIVAMTVPLNSGVFLMVENIDLKSVGYRIKAEREKLGYTRDEFSEIVGISSVYLSQIERAERQMSLPVFIKTASKLNLTLDYLIYGDDSFNVNKGDLINIINESSNRDLKILADIFKIVLPNLKNRNQ